jgi:hypothetical protein
MNVNADINHNVNGYGGYGGYGYGGYGYRGGAIAAGVVAGAVVGAAVAGSYYPVLPSGCVSVYRVTAYYQCGSVWYQPTYVGTEVQYVVVNEP